jgi:hypothetical protein
MKQDDGNSNFKNKLGKLPPPLFGEDDCDRPACHDMMSQMKKASQASQEKKAVDCPPNSGVLGRASWTLLHTMVRANGIPTSVLNTTSDFPRSLSLRLIYYRPLGIRINQLRKISSTWKVS